MGKPQGVKQTERDEAVALLQVQTHSSTLVEKSLEYSFLAGLSAELLKRGANFDILRADCDRAGYDVVVEANGIMRHIQLKGMKAGGRRRNVSVNIGLASRPSGCVIWMVYDPATFSIVSYRWFGSVAGGPLPHPGDRIAKHSKANMDRVKAEKPQHRIVPLSRFKELSTMAQVTDWLFADGHEVTRKHLLKTGPQPDEPEWVDAVRRGAFTHVPPDLDWSTSFPLAMMIDGYRLAEELGIRDPVEFEGRQLNVAAATGAWPGNAARLWITLFLEHRRWYFSSPHEPNADAVRLLDCLVRQLCQALTGKTSH